VGSGGRAGLDKESLEISEPAQGRGSAGPDAAVLGVDGAPESCSRGVQTAGGVKSIRNESVYNRARCCTESCEMPARRPEQVTHPSRSNLHRGRFGPMVASCRVLAAARLRSPKVTCAFVLSAVPATLAALIAGTEAGRTDCQVFPTQEPRSPAARRRASRPRDMGPCAE
jgi:hypothetical protein